MQVADATLPRVGLGLWKIDKATTADLVYQAINAGYRHLDSAADYGNEAQAGDGIADLVELVAADIGRADEIRVLATGPLIEINVAGRFGSLDAEPVGQEGHFNGMIDVFHCNSSIAPNLSERKSQSPGAMGGDALAEFVNRPASCPSNRRCNWREPASLPAILF